jgi:hypothetical protein
VLCLSTSDDSFILMVIPLDANSGPENVKCFSINTFMAIGSLLFSFCVEYFYSFKSCVLFFLLVTVMAIILHVSDFYLVRLYREGNEHFW